jgi:hypothetical protein
LKLFEKAEPGESIQVDVKYVKISGRWAFQYTTLDDCTRFRVPRLYRRLHHGSSLAFLAEFRRTYPFPIKGCSATMDRRSPYSYWGSRPRGFGVGTFGPVPANRTAKSSGAIGLIRRGFGASNASRSSRWSLQLCGTGD